jgi:AbiJ N-terminal domain 4
MAVTRKPFSKRHGYPREAPDITIREEAPESLRYFLLQTGIDLGLTPHALRDDVCAVLRVRPDPNNWSAYPNVWDETQSLVFGCEWYRVYDIIERVYQRFHDIDEEDQRKRLALQFEHTMNEFFIDEGIGWQMTKGDIVNRGTEAFETTVHTASTALHEAGRTTAKGEIHEALADLSRRPEPDLTGAVQHAMAALECVAREACGNNKATLGDIIKRHPDLIPKPLDAAVEKAWGYASEMGRHIREGREPARKEVELIVGLAATVATYLSQ